MPDSPTARDAIRRLDLNAEQRAVLGEVVAASVAVNVYRQLETARGDSGCNIIGNCSSSSKIVAEDIVG
jgi:hypothetical protein